MAGQPVDRSESIYVENKQSEFAVDTEAIKKAAAFVLDIEGSAGGEVTITFVDAAEMAELNKQFRGIEGPTDVLSFSMTESTEDEPKTDSSDGEEILGDVIVCPAVTAENARDLGHSQEREILEITIHGLLHLLGYEHGDLAAETAMIARQEQLAGMFNET